MFYPLSIENSKTTSKVLILGPYGPFVNLSEKESSSGQVKLEEIKKYLIANGFKNAHLVSDWSIEKDIPREAMSSHFQAKSFDCIDNWAEILLFIWIDGCDNSGVEREFSHLVERTWNKCFCSAVLFPKSLKISSMIEADLKNERIDEYDYENNEDLLSLSFSACFQILYRLMKYSRLSF